MATATPGNPIPPQRVFLTRECVFAGEEIEAVAIGGSKPALSARRQPTQ